MALSCTVDPAHTEAALPETEREGVAATVTGTVWVAEHKPLVPATEMTVLEAGIMITEEELAPVLQV